MFPTLRRLPLPGGWLSGLPLVLFALVLLLAPAASGQRGGDASSQEEAEEPVDPRACVTCHDSTGVSGHYPPAVKGCYGCHVEVQADGAPSGGEAQGELAHLQFEPATELTCQGCHPVEIFETPHQPAEEGRCLACHDPHDRSKKSQHLWEKRQDAVCEGCHERQDGHDYTHTEVLLGRCSGCHQPHGADQEFLLKGETPTDACVDCHEAQFDEDTHDHWPAYVGRCDACHDPHGSNEPGALILPVKDTCYQCHPSKETGDQVHSAVVLGRCAECHDPHGSEQDRKLRANPVSGVCFRCHNDDITGRPVVHKPIADGRCITCHDPHTSPTPKNLRAEVNVTCGMCHPDKYRPDVETPHPAVLTYGCTVCHDPHASDYPFRLRKPIIELCTTCHVGFDDGYHVVQRPQGGGHPIGGKDDPLRPGRELVCSSCHDPHGTDNPRMWYRAFERPALCVECHRSELAPSSTSGASTFERTADQERRLEEQRRNEPSPPTGSPAPVEPEPAPPAAPPEDAPEGAPASDESQPSPGP